MVDAARTSTTRPYRWPLALVAVAAFGVLTAFMWHSTRPMTWERPIITDIDRVPIPARQFWISMFQPVPFTLMAVALAFVGAVRGRTRIAVSGLLGCVGAILASEFVFKPLVDRMRTHTAGIHRVILVGGQMFPSAHVTAAAALAMFAWLILDRSPVVAPFLALVPLAVAGAAISAQLHYPADVLGGMLLGSTVVYCIVVIANAFMHALDEGVFDQKDPVRASR